MYVLRDNDILFNLHPKELKLREISLVKLFCIKKVPNKCFEEKFSAEQ